ncbi:hypothetical protein [Arthrobacter pigmenti]
MSSAPERRPVTIRRAPKIIPFLVLGALLGLICAGIIAFTGPESGQFSRGTVLGFFSALLLIPGLLLGAIAALVFDWLSVRRSRKAIAESTGPAPTRESVDEDDAAANRGPGDEGGGGAIHRPGEPEGRADTNGDDAGRNR